eukprot:6253180-Heterocapsa_arctica.AAC.1
MGPAAQRWGNHPHNSGQDRAGRHAPAQHHGTGQRKARAVRHGFAQLLRLPAPHLGHPGRKARHTRARSGRERGIHAPSLPQRDA